MARPKKIRQKPVSSTIDSLVALPRKVRTAVQDMFLNKPQKSRAPIKAPTSIDLYVEGLRAEQKPKLLQIAEEFDTSYARTQVRKHKYEDIPVVRISLDSTFPFLHVRYGKSLFDWKKVIHYNKRPAGWDYSWYDFMSKTKYLSKKLAQVAYDLAYGSWKKVRQGADAMNLYHQGWGKGYTWTI